MEAQIRQKDVQLRDLRKEYDNFKAEMTVHQDNTRTVLEKATHKISELKKEVKLLRAASSSTKRISNSSTEMTEAAPIIQSRPKITTDVKDSDLKSLEQSWSSGHRVEEPVAAFSSTRRQSLREKFHEDDEPKISKLQDRKLRSTSRILADRVNLEAPRWRPFIPRSPRNREYLGPDLNNRIISSSSIPSGATPAPQTRWRDGDGLHVDLLQDKFTRLGVLDGNGSALLLANTSRSTLPPERRAAAIARIEQRKAEKKRGPYHDTHNKENIGP
jgi:hypothetical protein